jgi:hypothetical protein
MQSERIGVYLWLYSPTSDESQDEVWGHIIKPQIGRLCPEGWTSDIGYPRQEQDIQTAYVCEHLQYNTFCTVTLTKTRRRSSSLPWRKPFAWKKTFLALIHGNIFIT